LRSNYDALPVIDAGPQSHYMLVGDEYDTCHDKDDACYARPVESFSRCVEPNGCKHQPDHGSRTKLGHTSPNRLVSCLKWWRDHERSNYAYEETGRGCELGPVSLQVA